MNKRKRATQTQGMVDAFNQYLVNNNVVNEFDPQLIVFCSCLQKIGQYRGFNYYKHNSIRFEVIAIPSDAEYIKLY